MAGARKTLLTKNYRLSTAFLAPQEVDQNVNFLGAKKASAPSGKFIPTLAAMHPLSLRRSSLKYNPVFSVRFSLRERRLTTRGRNELTGRCTSEAPPQTDQKLTVGSL